MNETYWVTQTRDFTGKPMLSVDERPIDNTSQRYVRADIYDKLSQEFHETMIKYSKLVTSYIDMMTKLQGSLEDGRDRRPKKA